MRYSETVEGCKTPNANGFVNYGACLMAKGQLDKAIQMFQKAIELDSNHFEAIYDLGLLANIQRQFCVDYSLLIIRFVSETSGALHRSLILFSTVHGLLSLVAKRSMSGG